MAAKVDPLLIEILRRYDVDPKQALWDCHGTLVILHKHLERIAATAGIVFDPPQIIEAHSADKIVAICAFGHMGSRTEWSIGEAAPGNNKNSYPYAMAEKRAKDRVILKLVGLSGFVYSEEEADDFKASGRSPADVGAEPEKPPRSSAPAPAAAATRPAGELLWVAEDGTFEGFDKPKAWFEHALRKLRSSKSPAALWATNGKVADDIVDGAGPSWRTKAEADRQSCINAVQEASNLLSAA